MDNTDKLVTVLTATYPSELFVIKGRLESEGIFCFIKDELSTQINPFYSNALGGVKLQVKESDAEKALEILREGAYIKETVLQQPKFIAKLDRSTLRIPVLKKLQFELRLGILAALAIAILAGIIYIASLPSARENLTSKNWCLNQVLYGGKTYIPKTVDMMQLSRADICDERIRFGGFGRITIPGFNSRSVHGLWKLEKGALKISQVDSFDHVFNGTYEIDLSGSDLILRSDKTTLYCEAANTNVWQ